MRKRFSQTERLHLPYHVLLSVEEFFEDEPDVKHLPFIREVPIEPSGPTALTGRPPGGRRPSGLDEPL